MARPAQRRAAVAAIGDALAAPRPAGRAGIEGRAADYGAEIEALDAAIAAAWTLSRPERKLVTDHDAFGYFAERYESRSSAP